MWKDGEVRYLDQLEHNGRVLVPLQRTNQTFVGPVEDAELLLAMRGIVGGVDIEQDLATLADLLSAEANELIEQSIVQAHQIAGGRRILPATERGLGAERFSQLLIGDDL